MPTPLRRASHGFSVLFLAALMTACSGAPTGKPTLTLRYADGSRWQFMGQPTSATRYGSAGEQAFFEVTPQKVAASCD